MENVSLPKGKDTANLGWLGSDRSSLFYLFLTVLVGMGLRIHHLGYGSLWVDEGFTRYFSESPLSYLWTTGFRLETNPPLYYTIMHFWMPVFGTSEIALRSFSVLASVVAIILVYILGKELEGPTLGLIGGAIMALSPTEISYAQDARTYALLHAALALALVGIARYLSSSRPGNGLLLYTVGAILSVYSHDSALFFIFACNVAVISAAWWDKSFLAWPDLLRWFRANLIVTVAVGPVILNAFCQRNSPNIQWIDPVTLNGLQWTFADLLLGPQANQQWHHGRFLAFVVLALAGFFLWKRRNLSLHSIVILVLTPLIFVTVIVLISLYRPLLVSRVMFWTWIPLSLLLAHVLIHARARLPFFLLTALLFGSALYAQVFPQLNPNGDWRSLIKKNQEDFSKADTIIVTRAIANACVAYYLPAVARRVVYWHDEESDQRENVSELYFQDKFGLYRTTTAGFQDEIRSGKRICFIYTVGEKENVKSLLDSLPRPDDRFGGDSLDSNQLVLARWGQIYDRQ